MRFFSSDNAIVIGADEGDSMAYSLHIFEALPVFDQQIQEKRAAQEGREYADFKIDFDHQTDKQVCINHQNGAQQPGAGNKFSVIGPHESSHDMGGHQTHEADDAGDRDGAAGLNGGSDHKKIAGPLDIHPQIDGRFLINHKDIQIPDKKQGADEGHQ